MHRSLSPRRAAGLLAAGTIGLSTALLGVTGVAGAAPEEPVVLEELAAALVAPDAPQELEVDGVDDGSVTLSFLEPYHDPDTQSAITGYEVSTDGGTTWAALTTTTPYGNNEHIGTVTGLTNTTTYTVVVRATSAAGPSVASDPVDATPAKLVGAPGNVTVTTAPGKVTVTWTAPTEAGSYAIDGYDVGVFTDDMGDQLCATTAAVLTCTGDVPSGTEWKVSVGAFDTAGNRGEFSQPVNTGMIPFPATVPASNGSLTPGAGSSDTVVAGRTATFSGSGYAPLTRVTILMYSQPQVLTSVLADATGAFTVTVTVPAGTAPGQHTFVAAGVDGLGNTRYTTMTVTVSASGAAAVTATGAATATAGAAASGPVLANTGADLGLPLAGGVGLLVVGGGLIVAARRRSAA